MDIVGTAWENATAIYKNTLDGQPNIVSETALAADGRIGTPSEFVLYQRHVPSRMQAYRLQRKSTGKFNRA